MRAGRVLGEEAGKVRALTDGAEYGEGRWARRPLIFGEGGDWRVVGKVGHDEYCVCSNTYLANYNLAQRHPPQSLPKSRAVSVFSLFPLYFDISNLISFSSCYQANLRPSHQVRPLRTLPRPPAVSTDKFSTLVFSQTDSNLHAFPHHRPTLVQSVADALIDSVRVSFVQPEPGL